MLINPMGKLIQFPRHHPGRKWSPTEILAIREPPDTRQEVRQERSRIATTKAIQATAGNRERKKATRKKAIAGILDNGQWTITVLVRLIGEHTGESINRTTVTNLLKELEAEGLATRSGLFWTST